MGTNIKREKIFSFEFIFVVFFAFYCILPAVSITIKFYYAIAIAALYLVVISAKKRSVPIKQILFFVFIIFVISLLYFLLTDTKSISSEASNRGLKQLLSKFYQLSMMFMPILFLDWAKNRASRIERKSIIVFSFVLLFFVIARTISELAINPEITRNWLEFGETGKDNIANYFFVYAIPFSVVLFVFMIKGIKSIYGKIFAIIAVIYQLYFLVLSQYTLSVIISLVGIICMSFVRIKSKRLKVLAFGLLPLLLVLLPFSIKYAANKIPSHSISVRLGEVYDFMIGSGEMGYNMSGRLTLYKKAIIAFLQSPLRGNRSTNFDGHATFLTVFSDLGLLGGIPFCYLLYKAKKAIKLYLGDLNQYFTPYWIMFLIMGFTNPVHSSPAISFILWFIVPAVMLEFNRKGEVENAGMGK